MKDLSENTAVKSRHGNLTTELVQTAVVHEQGPPCNDSLCFCEVMNKFVINVCRLENRFFAICQVTLIDIALYRLF